MLNVYSIKDTKANIFHTPFYSANDETAKREVGMTVNNKSTLLHAYPEDYALMHIGSWDDMTGDLNLMEDKECICIAYSLKKQEGTNDK